MRETELWQRLAHHLGSAYCHVWADQTTLSALGGRSVNEALVAGIDCKRIWRAVWEQLELPAHER